MTLNKKKHFCCKKGRELPQCNGVEEQFGQLVCFFSIWREPKVETEEPTASKIPQSTVAGSPRRRRFGAGGKRPKREEAHVKKQSLTQFVLNSLDNQCLLWTIQIKICYRSESFNDSWFRHNSFQWVSVVPNFFNACFQDLSQSFLSHFSYFLFSMRILAAPDASFLFLSQTGYC